MDSLTQIVLGASVGEAILGKKIGNKAMLWGAIAGTIPDLDVLLRYFTDEISSTQMHRGFSHSIVFAVLIAPLLGWIAKKYPEIVKKIHAEGHEIGCHSMKHKLVHRMTPNQFREDTHRALNEIEKIVGEKVIMYRAPAFSITKDTTWAFEILNELGMKAHLQQEIIVLLLLQLKLGIVM